MSTRSNRVGAGSGALALFALVVAALAVSPVSTAGDEPAHEDASAANVVDEAVFGRLKELGLEPARTCDDATFVRRVALDLTGTLPGASKVRSFLASRDPGKRAAFVDECLATEEFADAFAMRWCKILRVKSEFPINLWPNAVQAYHRWIRTSIRDGTPLDRFARALLTSSGSNFRVPPVNFFRAVRSRDPTTVAHAVALTFLCERAERWPKERLDGFAAFFSRVGYKATVEWKEEIVFFDRAKTGGPKDGLLPDGTRVAFGPEVDPREAFADWLLDPTRRIFARAMANRVWSWLMGRGVVHEPDDFREDNPPSNPRLLASLEDALVASGYDFRRLVRLIATSRAYEQSFKPSSKDPRALENFGCYPLRRLDPEVLIDAIDQITGTTETYMSRIPEPFTYVPEEQRSIELADASVTSPFLDLFGRSPRDTGFESEQRDSPPTSAQRLHLLNSSHIRRKLAEGPGLAALLRQRTPDEAIDRLYLAILSRPPTVGDVAAFEAYAAREPQRAVLDLAWALINSAEFQHRH